MIINVCLIVVIVVISIILMLYNRLVKAKNSVKRAESGIDVVLKQMDLIGNIEDINSVEPMTFPFELDSVELRDDSESRNIEIEDALSNTGSKKGREIRVPKVVD